MIAIRHGGKQARKTAQRHFKGRRGDSEGGRHLSDLILDRCTKLHADRQTRHTQRGLCQIVGNCRGHSGSKRENQALKIQCAVDRVMSHRKWKKWAWAVHPIWTIFFISSVTSTLSILYEQDTMKTWRDRQTDKQAVSGSRGPYARERTCERGTWDYKTAHL